MFADVVLGRVVVAADGVVIIAPLALWSLPNRRRRVPSSCHPSPSLQSHHSQPPFFLVTADYGVVVVVMATA